MKKVIQYNTLRNFAYSNDKICVHPIKGIILNFRGLSNKEMIWEDEEVHVRFAKHGIIYLVPYYQPWCWMNDQTVAYVEEILDVIMDKYDLRDDIPIVSSGGSMGGLGSIMYTLKAKRMPVACVANCPVCDLLYLYTESPDLPRTLYHAYWHFEGTMEEALRANSPLYVASKLPDIDYYIFHCEEDKRVNKEMHSDRFVEEMKKHHRICYYSDPGRAHCDLSPEMRALSYQLMENSIKGVKR